MNLEYLSECIQSENKQDFQRINEMVIESPRKSRVLTTEHSPQVLKHHGLFSIKERLALIRKRLEVDIAQGVGTTCTLISPLTEVEPHQSEEKIVRIPCNTEQKFCILLVDDHAMIREGLSSLFKAQPDIEIVGEAADGEQAVALARKLRPNVILMDINMPKMNGIVATRIISTELPDIRIIGLSMHDDASSEAMLVAGAKTYLMKDVNSDEILAAIRYKN